jgi:hypothetical protein
MTHQESQIFIAFVLGNMNERVTDDKGPIRVEEHDDCVLVDDSHINRSKDVL